MNKRALTSALLFITFILLPLSGIPMHMAKETNWTLYHFCMSVHNMSATLFVIAAVLHVVWNWKPLTRSMIDKTRQIFRIRKEMLIALSLVVVFVGVFSMHAFHVH
jgi:hypothetical protein